MKSPERKVEKKPPRIRGAARRTGVASPIRCRRLRAAIGAQPKAQRAADTERIGKRSKPPIRSRRDPDRGGEGARIAGGAARGEARARSRAYWQALQRRDALRWPAQTDR